MMRVPRASGWALRVLGALLLADVALLLHAAWAQRAANARMATSRELVQSLQLTDTTWFTEARYGRHLSQADLHTAFQDGPGVPEHFPTGSLVQPPRHFPLAGLAETPPMARAAP